MMLQPLRSLLPEGCGLVWDRGTVPPTVRLCELAALSAARPFHTAHRRRLAPRRYSLGPQVLD